jgi:hypothetical protein
MHKVVAIPATLIAVPMFGLMQSVDAATNYAPQTRVTITLDPSLWREAITGRAFFIISRNSRTEPRLAQPDYDPPPSQISELIVAPFFGKDVESLKPGKSIMLDEQDIGFPLSSLRDIPGGDYSVQAVFSVYTKFPRADGHTVWLHQDQGEGQDVINSPGNLVSEPLRVHLDARRGFSVNLHLTRKVPPVEPTPDSVRVKHVRFQSRLMSSFWGHDMYVGATVVLPKGYEEHPDIRYPVVFQQGHFGQSPPFGFPETPPVVPGPDATASQHQMYERQKAFLEAWDSDNFPRVVLVALQHSTPYYDASYWINSANTGPWADVFLQEMIPFLESHYRIIPRPYARAMAGGSTGGLTVAALQIHYPDQFVGAWSFCPDPVDFREYFNVDIYADDNAFSVSGNSWIPVERYVMRSVKDQPLMSLRQWSQWGAALGSHGRSGSDLDNNNAMYGPVGSDGYPQPLWDSRTGKIDHEVAEYWRVHGYDLRDYLEKNWSMIGPQVANRLHFASGDADNFYLSLGMYRMEDFLKRAQNPPYLESFKWARPMIGHGFDTVGSAVGYRPWPIALIETMAADIAKHAPVSDDPRSWNYH